ncbi:MAG: CDP-alcohol phosphatidyltransferase family protein [Candidatus Aenigmarchaeota archaeon]|nr:CDP-alcohol phosphatidyltransferase family protein [Candidatus Aenigmarchaeota archaeon]
MRKPKHMHSIAFGALKMIMDTFDEFKRKALKETDMWWARHVIRKFSSRISWFLVRRCPNITPNQVTIFSTFVGFIGAFLFFIGDYKYAVVAAVVLFLWNITDGVDGEIARYKKMKSVSGLFLELTLDILVLIFCFLGIIFLVYKNTNSIFILIVGLLDITFFLFYRLADASKFWALFLSGKSQIDIQLSLKQVKQDYKFSNGSLIQIGRFIDKMGWNLYYSGHIVPMILFFSLIDSIFQPKVMLYTFPITSLSIFLILYIIFIPLTMFRISVHFITLKIGEGGSHDEN